MPLDINQEFLDETNDYVGVSIVCHECNTRVDFGCSYKEYLEYRGGAGADEAFTNMNIELINILNNKNCPTCDV